MTKLDQWLVARGHKEALGADRHVCCLDNGDISQVYTHVTIDQMVYFAYMSLLYSNSTSIQLYKKYTYSPYRLWQATCTYHIYFPKKGACEFWAWVPPKPLGSSCVRWWTWWAGWSCKPHFTCCLQQLACILMTLGTARLTFWLLTGVNTWNTGVCFLLVDSGSFREFLFCFKFCVFKEFSDFKSIH